MQSKREEKTYPALTVGLPEGNPHVFVGRDVVLAEELLEGLSGLPGVVCSRVRGDQLQSGIRRAACYSR